MKEGIEDIQNRRQRYTIVVVVSRYDDVSISYNLTSLIKKKTGKSR